MTGRIYAHFRASTADTDRTVDVLQRSFAEGRLTRDELDLRLGRALLSRFFDELMAITDDLPVGTFGRLPAHPVTPPFRRPARWRAAVGVATLVLGALLVLAAIATLARA
jgi:Domain of unknown function (DUF1707)